MPIQSPERRERVIWISEHLVLDAVRALLGVKSPQQPVRVISPGLDLSQLTVLRTTYDFSRRAIGFLVGHPSFEPVGEGLPAPVLPLEFTVEEPPSTGGMFIPMTAEEGRALMSALATGGIVQGPRIRVFPNDDATHHVVQESKR